MVRLFGVNARLAMLTSKCAALAGRAAASARARAATGAAAKAGRDERRTGPPRWGPLVAGLGVGSVVADPDRALHLAAVLVLLARVIEGTARVVEAALVDDARRGEDGAAVEGAVERGDRMRGVAAAHHPAHGVAGLDDD